MEKSSETPPFAHLDKEKTDADGKKTYLDEYTGEYVSKK
jgi:hypothetical protein